MKAESRDPLSEEMLLAQEKRREETLEKMKAEGAPQKAIAQMEKQLRLTRLRLERYRKKTETT